MPIPAPQVRTAVDVYPLMPADARITTNPPGLVLDGLAFPITPDEAERLHRLMPTLAGRVPLSEMRLPHEDAILVQPARNSISCGSSSPGKQVTSATSWRRSPGGVSLRPPF